MAEDLKLIAKVVLDSKDAEQSISSIKAVLEKAREEQRKLTEEFGAASDQAKAAADQVRLLEDSLKFAIDPINAINSELEATKQELEQVNAEFGKTSPEAEALNAQISNLEGSITALQDPIKFFEAELVKAEGTLQETVTTFGAISPEAQAAADAVGLIQQSLEAVKNTDASASIEVFNTKLRDAEVILQDTITTFGELSPEAQEAAAAVDILKQTITSIETANIDEPIISLKTALSDAEGVLKTNIATFGEYSAEAQQARDAVASIKLELNEVAGVEVFDPVKLLNEQLEKGNQTLDETRAKFGAASTQAQQVTASVEGTKQKLTEINSVDVSQPVLSLNDQLTQTKDKLSQVVATFGEASPEAQAVSAEIESIQAKLDKVAASKIDEPVKSIKQQLKEANVELQNAVAKFGIGSAEAAKAAQKVAQLKDTIGDAKTLTDAFNPDQKFKGLGNAIQGAAGAFTALQGAQAIFGEQSEDVAKTLAKVQGALALSQGINSVLDAGDAFKALGSSAKQALAGIRTGIAATGIGVLLVALGAIVAYWDDIKGLVSGVSSEQGKLNELGEANLKAEEEKISALEGQEQQLKAQGKSEKEILQLKLAQTDEAIRAAEVNIENAKATKTAQVEAAERNQKILSGLLDFLSIPLTALLAGVDLLTEGLNKAGIISDESFAKFGNLRQKFKDTVSTLVFDPKKVAEEGDASIAAAEKTLNGLKEKRAGFQNQIGAIDKAAGEKASADAKKRAEEAKALQDKIDKDAQDRAKRAADFQAETDRLVQANRLAAITDAAVKERQVLEEQYQAQIDKLLAAKDAEEAALKASLDAGLIDSTQYEAELTQIKERGNAQRTAIDTQYQAGLTDIAKKGQEARKKIEEETEDIQFEARIAGLEDGLAKEQEILSRAQGKRLDAQRELLEKGLITQADFDKRKLALEQTFQTEQTALSDKFALEGVNKQLKDVEDQIKNNDLAFQTRKDALDQQQALIDEAFAKGLIKEDEYNKKLQENADSRKAIAQAEVNVRLAQAKQIGDIVSGLSELIGKNTKTGKKVAIAGLVIQQAQTVAQVTTDTIRSTKAISAKYAGVPGGQIPAAVEIGINVAQGALAVAKAVKAVKQGIADINAASSSGSASGSADVNVGTPPLPPQPQTTTIDQGQVDQIGSATSTVRAYVVEQEVSDSQERLSRLERAARIS
jgi:hypothetical protein